MSPPRLDVRPDGFADASRVLVGDVSGPVGAAVDRLCSVLAGAEAMAGSDPGGVAWASSYDRVTAQAVAAGQGLVNGTYRVGCLLEQTAANHARADAASTAGGVGVSGRQWLHDPSYRHPHAAVPSAAGGSGGAPSGWGLVTHLVGYVWPDGHQDRLHAAGTAWAAAAGVVEQAAATVPLASVSIIEQSSPEVDDALTATTALATHHLDLAAVYRTLSTACHELAHHLDQVHALVTDELSSLLEWSAGIQAVGGALSCLSFGVAEVPTQAAQYARIAATAATVRQLIETFTATARVLVHTIPTLAHTADTITIAMDRLLTTRIVTAGVTTARALPVTTRTATTVKTAEMTAEERLAATVARGGARLAKSSDGGIAGATGNTGKLATIYGRTRQQIKEAIHQVKKSSSFPGNPDVVIDSTGEVYPLGHDGLAGDSIGNILDYLGVP